MNRNITVAVVAVTGSDQPQPQKLTCLVENPNFRPRPIRDSARVRDDYLKGLLAFFQAEFVLHYRMTAGQVVAFRQ